MVNEQNLIPLNRRTKEEQREIAKAGGKASGVSRKRTKKLKECMEAILSAQVIDEKRKEMLLALGVGEDATNKTLLVAALFNKAVLLGDVSAFKEIRNLIGEDDRNTEDVLAKLDDVLNEIGGNL